VTLAVGLGDRRRIVVVRDKVSFSSVRSYKSLKEGGQFFLVVLSTNR
jgi:hypothetical protein